MSGLPRFRPRGLSLLEVAIILMVVAAASMFAIPRIQSSRIVANETNAREVLREIQAAERQFLAQNAGKTYGVLAELLGAVELRPVQSKPRTLVRPGLRSQGPAFSEKGYLFTVFLPGHGVRGLTGVAEVNLANLDLGRMNQGFLAYAWPVMHGYSGRTVYAIDATGELRQYRNDRDPPFSGLGDPPPANLAAVSGDPFGGPSAELRDVHFDPLSAR